MSKSLHNLTKPLLKRLAVYRQIIRSAARDGKVKISSEDLAKLLSIDATTVRKDMASIGVVGTPRVGYGVLSTLSELEKFLGISEKSSAVLIGCGSLGSALIGYEGFISYGLQIVAAFDSDPSKVNKQVAGRDVLSMDRCKCFLSESGIDIAILTTPSKVAQQIADDLVEWGVRAIWNFCHVSLSVPDSVVVRNENLAAGLAELIHMKRCK